MRKLFKGGNYSRAETIWWNTVCKFVTPFLHSARREGPLKSGNSFRQRQWVALYFHIINICVLNNIFVSTNAYPNIAFFFAILRFDSELYYIAVQQICKLRWHFSKKADSINAWIFYFDTLNNLIFRIIIFSNFLFDFMTCMCTCFNISSRGKKIIFTWFVLWKNCRPFMMHLDI